MIALCFASSLWFLFLNVDSVPNSHDSICDPAERVSVIIDVFRHHSWKLDTVRESLLCSSMRPTHVPQKL